MTRPDARRAALVADIGGTNTRVALADGRAIRPGSVHRFRNAEFQGLEAVLRAYLDGAGKPGCAAACVAVAGPVHDGAAAMTNLDWTIDTALLARATGAGRVAILNDLQAQGHALGHLGGDALRPIQPGPAQPPANAARLVVGVGTGFNAAPVHQISGGRIVPPSEAGHITLPAATSEADLRLLRAIEAAHGFASVEEVLSGRGLEWLHGWLSAEAGQPAHAPAAAIMAALASGEDRQAEATAATFTRLLGAVAGDLALLHLPFGGLHLCGGVARAFAPYLGRFGFSQAFCAKGRFSAFMRNFPVMVVEDDYAALTGCAAYLAATA